MSNAQIAVLVLQTVRGLSELLAALDAQGIDESELTPEQRAELRALRHAERERTRLLTPVPDRETT